MNKPQELHQVVGIGENLVVIDPLGTPTNPGETIVAPKEDEPGLSYEEAILFVNSGNYSLAETKKPTLVSDC